MNLQLPISPDDLPLFAVAHAAPEPVVLQVRDVAARIRTAVEVEFMNPVWVEGELTNLRRQTGSGHLYFSLKDTETDARLDAVWFRSQQTAFASEMADGQLVRVYGLISVYEPRSAYQIRAQRVEPAGRGALYLALERLKKKLGAEGLFDPARKRPLPLLPRCIGVATSPSGAAIRDILRVTRRRFPNMRILVAPCRVQGPGAPEEIAAAVDRLSARPDVDVVIVARGGGSTEDLWAFNEEVVVRAIARCAHPVVSGVGHETDFTLADFAADVRAPTPSAAAMSAVPDRAELEGRVMELARRMEQVMRHRVDRERHRVERCAAHPWLRDPRRELRRISDRTRELGRSLALTVQRRTADWRQRLDELMQRGLETLRTRRAVAAQRLAHLSAERMETAARRAIETRRRQVTQLHARLHALSPFAVLQRGYSITFHPDGRIIRRADEVQPGHRIRTRLADGMIDSQVQTTTMDNSPL